MSLRLPALGSVDRSRPIEPFVSDDPDGGVVKVQDGAFPGDPAPWLGPAPGGRCYSPRPAGPGLR